MFEKIYFTISFIVILSGTFIIGNIANYLANNKQWKSSSTRKFNHFERADNEYIRQYWYKQFHHNIVWPLPADD